jgi:hypothetical protein
VIKHETSNTTQKRSGKVHTGRLPITRDQKITSIQIKSENNGADFFLVLEGFVFMNLYQLDKQSTKFTIWKYWKGCVKKLDGNDPNLHHDNASAHTALSVREFLSTQQITIGTPCQFT